ncbi:MAG TPA: SsrA-binding protein SmpB [Candidatus Paceibacterota bacterium]|nr:SsrA-binding protein SmpB [Candidatus Paceibacterota bacterium]
MDLLRHKKAHLNYEILEQFEAGIELEGGEVKSLRAHQGSLEGARAAVRGGEAYLIGATIPPYQPKNTAKDYDPERPRRLLLHKKELAELLGAESRKGLTIVPISMYNKGRKVKVAIAIVRGKKKFDKREDLKKRDTDRDIQRTLKGE